MMTSTTRLPEKLVAIGVGLLGWVVALGRVTGNDALLLLIPNTVGMVLNTALLFIITSFCLWPTPLFKNDSYNARQAQVARGCAWILILLPSAILLQFATGMNFGIDWAWLHPAGDGNPHPGRVAALTCLAFIFTGTALLTLRRTTPGKTRLWTAIVTVYATLITGMVTLLAYALGLDVVYAFSTYSKMAAATAAGISLTGIGLWLRLRQRQALMGISTKETADRRITRTAVLVLTSVVAITGLTGFIILKQGFDISMADAFRRSAKNNAATFSATLDQQLQINTIIASRPNLRLNLQKLLDNPRDPQALALIGEVIGSFSAFGMSGLQIHDAGGKLLSSAGTLERANAILSIPLHSAGQQVNLLWKDGFLLSADIPIKQGDLFLGTLVTEQRLPLLTGMLLNAERESASSHIMVCGRQGSEVAACFPNRFFPANQHVPLYRDGKPYLAMSHALQGQEGVMMYQDLRGASVLGGYAPIGTRGLGLVLKADTLELYAPIRERFNLLIGLLVLLVVTGALILRAQVQPLARQLLTRQQRMQGMLDGSQEAFIEIDQDGVITDWNTEAERLFGWLRHEVLGRPMAETIMPQASRAMHARGLAQFLKTGEGSVLGKRIELLALHQDGREIPLEITISAMKNGDSYNFLAFMHDITERKATEQKIIGSEKRLHAITDNLPVLIAYIDTNHCCQFANGTFETWLGVVPDKIMGAAFKEIIGSKAHAEQLPYIERALAGNRVGFETDTLMQGGTRHLQHTFIPDMAADGSVTGIYTLSTDVTALVQSKRRIRTITDNMPARIAYIDAGQRFRFCNRLYQTVAGIDADNMLGRTMCEVFGEEIYSQIAPQVAAVLKGEPIFFERLVHKGEISKYLEYAYIPELDADNKVLGFYSMVTDATVRRESEIAREKEHELLKAILDTVDVGVVACDERGELTLFNRATREFHGLPQCQLPAEEWAAYYSLFHADGQTPMQMQDVPLYRALKGEQVNLDEMVIVSAAGITRKLAASGRPLTGKNGENMGAVVVISDITERRQIQDSLLANESRLRRLMNSSLIGIIQSDADGCLIEANEVFFQFSGYSREALQAGKLNWLQMTSSCCHERQQQAIQELIQRGVASPFESELIRQDGTLAPIFIGIAHLEGSEQEWVSFVLDLTEQRRLDRLKSEFISVVSHELRTPLTSIRGSLGLLEGGVGGPLPPQALHLVKIAHKNSRRLVNLVNDILDIEKLAAGAIELNIQRLDLVALAAHSIEANAAYAQTYQVKYILREYAEPVWVMGDADRLMQALANLLSNAAKFSPRGEQVLIRIIQSGNSVRLEVEDRGTGIPLAFEERIFGKFAQADGNNTRQQGGTGLGLHITKTLIEKMDGEIGFRAGTTQGTVFWFAIPAGETSINTPDSEQSPAKLVLS